ncbi:hypothetical protein [Mesobacillus harenae]|uniref:hypothetical protein n=1 Tax=Mesobacillus harenae TaxID=2213203 RepID=UPI0015803C65|nr:hypothetical protein [Mesobacillus harenae]
MLKYLIQLITGFVSGYLFIQWVPIPLPFVFSELVVEFVLDPLEFFAAALAFILGVTSLGSIIEDGFDHTVKFFKGKRTSFLGVIVLVLTLIGFYFLFNEGFWQTSIFFGFSCLYGMISVDKAARN